MLLLLHFWKFLRFSFICKIIQFFLMVLVIFGRNRLYVITRGILFDFFRVSFSVIKSIQYIYRYVYIYIYLCIYIIFQYIYIYIHYIYILYFNIYIYIYIIYIYIYIYILLIKKCSKKLNYLICKTRLLNESHCIRHFLRL